MLWGYFWNLHYWFVLLQGLLFHDAFTSCWTPSVSTITGSFHGLYPWVPRIKACTVDPSGHIERGSLGEGIKWGACGLCQIKGGLWIFNCIGCFLKVDCRLAPLSISFFFALSPDPLVEIEGRRVLFGWIFWGIPYWVLKSIFHLFLSFFWGVLLLNRSFRCCVQIYWMLICVYDYVYAFHMADG